MVIQPGSAAARRPAPRAPADWTLAPLTEGERPLFAQLAEFYLYDFTGFAAWDVGEDGRFGRDAWPRSLWERDGRHPLLLRVRGRPAGFAVVDERSPLPGGEDRRYVAEFFVLRRYRRLGYGAAMAGAIFDRIPGRWHVLQMEQNTAAQAFWRRVIGGYTGGRYTEFVHRGEPVQGFDTRDKAGT